jgi:hypothetical protein
MTKNFTLLIFLVSAFIYSSGHAQETKNFNIPWHQAEYVSIKPGSRNTVLTSGQAITQSNTGLLPWFVASIQSDVTSSFDHARLVNMVFDTVPPTIADILVDADLIGDEFLVQFRQPDRSYNLAEGARVMPLRFRNGILERLLSFDLLYQIEENTQLRFDEPMPDYAEQSVLSTGDWYKIGVQQSGVYKIDYGQLQDMGIDPASVDPQKIGLFGNGNGMLPESNSVSRIDDLAENAIYVHGESDGVFDEGDYLLFYGQSPVKVAFNPLTNRLDHKVNFYTDTTFYFLTVELENQGKRIEEMPQASGPVDHEVSRHLAYQYHENDWHNLLASGREWYGEEFSTLSPSFDVGFDFPGLLADMPVHIQTHFVGRSVTEDMYFDLEVNAEQVIDMTQLRRVTSNESLHARESIRMAQFNASEPQLNVRANFYANDNGSRAWLNYIRINAWCQLHFSGGQFAFSNPELIATESISRFTIGGNGQGARLWDITNPLQILNQQYSANAEGISFVANTAQVMRKYILFDDSQFLQIASARKIPNQNLHAIHDAEYLIVTDPRFTESANELAEFHTEHQGLDVRVVNVKEIYNEFGGGAPDITAVRDFVRMVYLRSNQNLKYLLLFGDASYDYKDRVHSNTNCVPTYQAQESLRETASWVTDDYFGLMGYNEGYLMAGTLDVGIGRFPVNTTAEAELLVSKVKHYMTPSEAVAADWRNVIAFVGDDEDNNLHLDQAEALSRIVDTARNILNINKIYFDAYPRQAVAGGFRYPDANKAFVDRINEGALLINYTGHGGVNGLADERVLTIPDVTGLDNMDNMPFFITATCEFSRYDNPEFVSAGERLVLNPNGGGIALMTTTRLAFAHSNFFLNRKIYAALFNSEKAEINRLGDAIRISKSPSNASVYNFVLLGDPALRPASPERRVETTSFNNVDVSVRHDTIKAMMVVDVRGKVTHTSGMIDQDFNGYVYPKVFDKKSIYRTLGNSSSSQPTNFSYHDRLIFSGKVTVKDGLFSFSFPVPRDIAYQYGEGRISYYAVDTTSFADAAGQFNGLTIGGFADDVVLDQTGPDIDLYLNRPEFESGDLIRNEVVVYARIADPQGVNHLGVGIGRDMMGYLNNNTALAYNLNNKFVPDVDNYTSGSLELKLPWLENGEHSFKLKAWDLHNNSSEYEVFFVIDDQAELVLSKLHNKPNPFSDRTTFVFEHNKVGGTVDLKLDIFRMDGQWVTSLESKNLLMINQYVSLDWDGRDANGQLLPSGLYVYRFQLTDETGKQIVVHQKLMIAR